MLTRDETGRLGSWASSRAAKRGTALSFLPNKHRKVAEDLRCSNPELYRQILAQAEGTEAEEAARANPDVYVALLLAEAEGTEAEEAARANPDVYVALLLAEAEDAGYSMHGGVIPEGEAPTDFYARSSTDAANRALRGVASDHDFEELDQLGDAGSKGAIR